MNSIIEITPKELKKRFEDYFKETMGIKPYTKCPWCQKKLLPRKKYSHFIGCSGYPDCTFIANQKQPYTPKK